MLKPLQWPLLSIRCTDTVMPAIPYSRLHCTHTDICTCTISLPLPFSRLCPPVPLCNFQLQQQQSLAATCSDAIALLCCVGVQTMRSKFVRPFLFLPSCSPAIMPFSVLSLFFKELFFLSVFSSASLHIFLSQSQSSHTISISSSLENGLAGTAPRQLLLICCPDFLFHFKPVSCGHHVQRLPARFHFSFSRWYHFLQWLSSGIKETQWGSLLVRTTIELKQC